jgi:iron complex outermembrane recepter protein
VEVKSGSLSGVHLRRGLFAALYWLVLIRLAPALAQTAPAQDSTASGTGQLQEIVVTAQRRSERLQDVPIAVTALDAAALQSAGIKGTSDLAQAVPGLSFNTQGGGFAQPRIRGVGIAGSAPGVENPVAVYIDGVYYGASNSLLFDLYDIAQVAVLKGPQGTLFGRNATGGLIQVTTRDPSQSPSADLLGTVGNKQSFGTDLFLTGGLVGPLAGSIAFHLDDQNDGFGRNLPTNQEVDQHHSYASRGKLQFVPDDATKATLSMDYSERHSSEFAIRVLGLQPYTGTPAPGGPFDTDLNAAGLFDLRQWGASLNVQHDFGGARLVSTTAYRYSFMHNFFDGDQSPFDAVFVQVNDREQQVSQELQLISSDAGRLSWQLGLFYYWSRGEYPPFETDIVSILPPGAPPVAAQSLYYSREELNSYAEYGQATYKVNDTTNVTAGLRYTIDKRSHENTNDFIIPAFFSTTTTGGAASKDFDKLTWRFSVDHHFSQDVLGYASYNRGFKSGAFDAAAIPAAVYKPETLDAFEIGTKTEFLEHRARLNVATFYYNYTNIQVTQFSNHTEFIYNGKGARSYGLDLDLTGNLTNALSVNAGVSLIHARYESFPNAFQTTPNPACAGVGCGGNTVTLTDNATGHKLQNTPDYTFNTGVSYLIPVSFGALTMSANYYFNGGYFSEPENRLRQPSYGVLDTTAMWSSNNGRYEARLWGKNLTNKVYASQLNAIDVGDARIAAPGRTFGITGGIHF